MKEVRRAGRSFIIEHFGEQVYQDWLSQTSQAICFSDDSFGSGVAALDYPDYPQDPKCLGYPDGHETAVAIFGMEAAGITELKGGSLEVLTKWLMYYPDSDQYSIGIRIQALLYGGVSMNETWETADNRMVSMKSLMDNAIEEWRKEKDIEDLSPGDVPKDMLLHLAPSLIVFQQRHPEEFSRYGYRSALRLPLHTGLALSPGIIVPNGIVISGHNLKASSLSYSSPSRKVLTFSSRSGK